MHANLGVIIPDKKRRAILYDGIMDNIISAALNNGVDYVGDPIQIIPTVYQSSLISFAQKKEMTEVTLSSLVYDLYVYDEYYYASDANPNNVSIINNIWEHAAPSDWLYTFDIHI